MLDLQSVLTMLDGDNVDMGAVKESITTLTNQVEEKGKSLYTKKDKELLKFKTALKTAGWDSEKHANIDEFVSGLKQKNDSISATEVTIAQLNDKLKTIETALTTERQTRVDAEARAKNSSLTATLTSKIGKDYFGSNYLIKDLIETGRVDIAENGKIVGRDGDEVISLDSLLATVKEENKGMLKITQKGGSGGSGGSGAPLTDEDSFIKKIRDGMV